MMSNHTETAIFHTCAMEYDLLNRKKDRRKMNSIIKSLFAKYYEIVTISRRDILLT